MIKQFGEMFVNFYAVVALYSPLSFFVLWGIARTIHKENKRAIRLASDLTVFLLIGPVSVLMNRLFHMQFGFYLLLILFLVSLGLMGRIQYQIRGEIDAQKLIRMVWRISFLFLGLLYIFLITIELGKLVYRILF